MQGWKEVAGSGQESVWDYPRPPRVEDCGAHVQVIAGGIQIADSRRVKRVLETSHPPTYYVPPSHVLEQHLIPARKRTFCEWKGFAHYFDVRAGERVIREAAWSYPAPTRPFMAIRDHLAFYPHLMDACFVNGERVQAQAGSFYGGWITSTIVGPFKGEPGTEYW